MFYNLDIYQGSVEHFVSFLSKLGTMLIYGEAKKLLVLRNVMNASNVRLSSRRICGNSLKKNTTYFNFTEMNCLSVFVSVLYGILRNVATSFCKV